MGDINFHGEPKITKSAFGENATIIFNESNNDFSTIEMDLKNFRELIARNKDNKKILNAIDKSIKAAKIKDESKLKKCLKTLKGVAGDSLKEFSSTFLSDVLKKFLFS